MKSTVLSVVLLGLSACGNLTGARNTMSADEANAFAKQVAQALSHSLANVSAAPALAGQGIHGPLPVSVNVTVDHTTNCTAGGSIHVLGSMTGNIDDQGTGMLLLQVDETILDWKCIGDMVINSAPEISAAGNMAFLSGSLSTAATFNLGGAIEWGTSSSEGCQANLSIIIEPDNTGSATGSICGHTVHITI